MKWYGRKAAGDRRLVVCTTRRPGREPDRAGAMYSASLTWDPEWPDDMTIELDRESRDLRTTWSMGMWRLRWGGEERGARVSRLREGRVMIERYAAAGQPAVAVSFSWWLVARFYVAVGWRKFSALVGGLAGRMV